MLVPLLLLLLSVLVLLELVLPLLVLFLRLAVLVESSIVVALASACPVGYGSRRTEGVHQ